MRATGSQLDAINADGNVLVAAGAGAGKTSTLVQRCVQRLLAEDHPAAIDEILMVTFTEAAASEMRARVRGKLEAELVARAAAAGDPLVTHIQQQLALIDSAHISTLHSFCFGLVRENFHELGIDPQLRVLDEAESSLLKEDALDTLLQRYYASKTDADTAAGQLTSGAVQELIQVCGEGKEEPVRTLLLRIHEYTQTRVDPEEWLAGQEQLFSEAEPVTWRKWLLEALVQWKEEWRATLAAAEPGSDANAFGKALASAEPLDCLAGFAKAFQNAPAIGAPSKKQRPARFFKEASFLRSVLSSRDAVDPVAQDWQWIRGHLLTLLRLAREFFRDYASSKRETGTVDFHDLEQFSLALLQSHGKPTPLAREYQRQFRYVFVDECQDINAAQDAILRALSREGSDGELPNRFLVGDVKQSIYRFRLADPTIFQRYEADWNSEQSGARVIRLRENFRSREALLHFFNAVHRDLMRAEVGGIQFNEDAELTFGAPEERAALARAESAKPRVHLYLRLTGSSEEGEPSNGNGNGTNQADLSTAEHEARIVANALHQLHTSKHQVWDDKDRTFRDVNWRDMAILLRSPTAKAGIYAREFARQSIPLQVAQSDFFEAIESADLLNLLSVLDNPIQDVPLIAVLHSPFCGLTENELAEVRLAQRDVSFWAALTIFYTQGRDAELGQIAASAYEKVARFMERYKRWREMGRNASLSYRLQVILAETHYLDWLGATADNEQRATQRHANIRRFLALAEQFDPWQRQGLSRFLRFVDAQRQAASREPLAARGNAVQLISIHRSKGLEYPVVVLPDLGKKFNVDDLRANVILHSRYGLCPRIKPPHTRTKYPGVTHWLATRQERTEMLGEEIRLLYVAMTRARDTLLLVGTTARSTAEKWHDAERTAEQLLSASTALAWLGPWLARNAGASWLDTPSSENTFFSSRIFDEKATPPFARNDGSATPAQSIDDLVTRCQEAALHYPHAAATREAAKTSVSLLRRRMRDADEEAKPWMIRRRFEEKPDGHLSAAEVGLANHAVLELADIASLSDPEALREEIAGFVSTGLLRPAEAERIDVDALVRFWTCPIGQRIAGEAANGTIRRELAFTARFTTAELRQLGLVKELGSEDEFAIVQGVVDLAVILDDEIWLLDFKTDNVTTDKASSKAFEYRPQIIAYAEALRRIYGRPVTEKWLHFLAAGQTVSL